MSVPAALPFTVDGFVPLTLGEANRLLIEFEHNLGPCKRPFRSEPWAFLVDGRPVAVAISASIVSATAADLHRTEVVELARLAAAERWANRLMLRWWREVGARRWSCWPVKAAIAYSQNDRHEGRLYRFDGWRKFTERGGSSGGGTWSTKRTVDEPVLGSKTGWVYEYAEGGAS